MSFDIGPRLIFRTNRAEWDQIGALRRLRIVIELSGPWERVVSTYGDCRKYAAYCLEMAEATKSEESRVKYLELAQAWLSEALSQAPRKENAERPVKSH
jgi:hypothetical protein